mmetsp:Transcript_7562/g.23034  ORF Transcript_7562/g.23034 Transcript_7562/m.23034 type:complete len:216 (-) Transcript_7562:913-1560(-)
MGPTEAAKTGMASRSLPPRSLPGLRRNSRSASSAPRVEAWTETPRASVTRASTRPETSFMTSSLRSSRSSSGPQTITEVPGMTFSRSCPVTLRPIAAVTESCLISSLLTRVSREGGGVRRARACVTTAPSWVQRTSVSPSWSVPLTRMTSSVAPRPSTTLTSRTVHWRVVESMRVWVRRCWVRERMTRRRSGTPSPVMAEVGTTETVDPGSSFSQ